MSIYHVAVKDDLGNVIFHAFWMKYSYLLHFQNWAKYPQYVNVFPIYKKYSNSKIFSKVEKEGELKKGLKSEMKSSFFKNGMWCATTFWWCFMCKFYLV